MKEDNASMRRSFVVDLAGVQSAVRLHDALAAQLPLPQHYGRNLDAFHDVLTEFGGSWSIVFRNAGSAADGLRAVCADAMAETPGLVIVFEADGARDYLSRSPRRRQE